MAYWHEIAETLGLPANRLRPGDILGKDIGASLLTNIEPEDLQELICKQAQGRNIHVDLKSIRSMDDHVWYLAGGRFEGLALGFRKTSVLSESSAVHLCVTCRPVRAVVGAAHAGRLEQGNAQATVMAQPVIDVMAELDDALLVLGGIDEVVGLHGV